jgi:hypothetical protein
MVDDPCITGVRDSNWTGSRQSDDRQGKARAIVKLNENALKLDS